MLREVAIASKARLRARIVRLGAAGGVLAVIALSWMTIVDLIPRTSRPFVGSSSNDTVWNLAVGYNGFGRITGKRGGFGGRAGGTTSVTSWVERNCTAVSASAYGSTSATSGTAIVSTESLYHCG